MLNPKDKTCVEIFKVNGSINPLFLPVFFKAILAAPKGESKFWKIYIIEYLELCNV